MSEPSSPDSLLERQLPDWKTAVLNVVNEIDLENGSIWFGDQHAKSLIALEPRQCRVIALKILDANSVIARRVLNAMGPQSD
jgi:hypothetical protein